MEKLTINNWAEEDQPREKMASLGAEALSNAELLAILIGSGSTKESAVELMKRVLADCKNNLNTLGKRSISPEERPDLGTATRIYNHMHPIMQDLDVEEFWVLLLNQHYRLIKKLRISHGGITETAADIRIIIKEAVLANATILAVCHNHPSGNLSPSRQDDELTKSLDRACELMHIHFLDHVIITDGQYYSYHEQGRC